MLLTKIGSRASTDDFSRKQGDSVFVHLELFTPVNKDRNDMKSFVDPKFASQIEVRPKNETVPDSEIYKQRFEEVKLNKDTLKKKLRPVFRNANENMTTPRKKITSVLCRLPLKQLPILFS